MRAAGLALLLALAAAPDAHAQDAAGAEAAVEAYIAAFNDGDFEGAAELMDPVELEQFVALLGPLMELSGAPDNAGPVPQSAPGAFAWFLETMGGMAPGMTDAMQTADADILGSVAEGDSLVHVVMRTRASVMGIDAEQVSITSARRRDGRWVVALSGDLQTFAQTMEQFGDVFSEDPDDDDDGTMGPPDTDGGP